MEFHTSTYSRLKCTKGVRSRLPRWCARSEQIFDDAVQVLLDNAKLESQIALSRKARAAAAEICRRGTPGLSRLPDLTPGKRPLVSSTPVAAAKKQRRAAAPLSITKTVPVEFTAQQLSRIQDTNRGGPPAAGDQSASGAAEVGPRHITLQKKPQLLYVK